MTTTPPVLVEQSSLFMLAFCSGLASCTAEMMTFPFENIKIRMQMNGK